MITIFNSKSVYIGYDLNKFNEIRNYLDANRIRYKYKVKNRSGQWEGRGTRRGSMGSFGTSPELMYEYEILVHERDYDKVRL